MPTEAWAVIETNFWGLTEKYFYKLALVFKNTTKSVLEYNSVNQFCDT